MIARCISSGLIATLCLAGCGHSHHAATPQPAPATSAATGACTLRSGAAAVLALAMPADVTCTSEDGRLHVERDTRRFDIWLVEDAASIEAAVARIPSVIESEFKDFKTTSRTESTVGGTTARRVMGSGVEADDNDPGTADVVVFQVGGRTFVACMHGEHMIPAAEEWMMQLLQTARVP